MKKIRRILAPTDLSELSQAGVRYALNLAKAVGAEVMVYHVVNYEELLWYGEKMKEKIATDSTFGPPYSVLEKYQSALTQFLKTHFSELTPSVKVHEKVELGNPDINIVEAAEKEGADLIVLSTHGRTGLSHILLGSVTEKVVRHASCPVLSIRPYEGDKATEERKGSENGNEARTEGEVVHRP